ncbi:MAG: amidohydrolase family protein [Isosphaeraceae bacterium]
MNHGLIARDIASGKRIGVSWRDGLITEVVKLPGTPSVLDPWVSPAWIDIQTNGRWGISFSDPGLTVEQVERIVLAQASMGVARSCPTLITAPLEATEHGLRTIAEACDRNHGVARRIAGIHLEGPWISGVDGYRGAHPLDAVRDPNWADFERFQQACGHRIKLVTLAPERPGAIEFIQKLAEAGIVVALGHTAADPGTIDAAVDAGARLSTHLGNGIVATLPRHPNAIFHQAAEDLLMASMIGDGHHLDPATLKVLARAKSPAGTILVSDASPLAGMPVGDYGRWSVDASGKIVVSGTPYLAGSNQPLAVGIGHLLAWTGWTLAEAIATVTANPSRLLGLQEPALEPGQPADLVEFTTEMGRILIRQAWVAGGKVSGTDLSGINGS